MGYFLFMIIFMIIAVVRAKSGSCWIWYGIGVAIQLISIIGTTGHYNAIGFNNAAGSLWGSFFGIAIVGAIAIIIRKK